MDKNLQSFSKENKPFQIGDKVYCPTFSTFVLTITNELTEDKEYPFLAIKPNNNSVTEAFSTDGRFYDDDVVPSVFHATKENWERLSELYGMEFEKVELETPSKEPTPQEIIEAMLEKGLPVWACVSDASEEDARKSIGHDFLRIANVSDDGSCFWSTQNVKWLHAIPIDIEKMEEITKLPTNCQ